MWTHNTDFPAGGSDTSGAIAAHHAAQPHVLHVDADEDTALVLATLMMPEARVTHVHTLEAAARIVGEGDYSLLVLDPDLPDGDGAALFEALRKAGSTTPVLLYSARHTVWRDQASGFLLKPWTSPRQLWSTVTRLLGVSPAMSMEGR